MNRWRLFATIPPIVPTLWPIGPADPSSAQAELPATRPFRRQDRQDDVPLVFLRV